MPKPAQLAINLRPISSPDGIPVIAVNHEVAPVNFKQPRRWKGNARPYPHFAALPTSICENTLPYSNRRQTTLL